MQVMTFIIYKKGKENEEIFKYKFTPAQELDLNPTIWKDILARTINKEKLPGIFFVRYYAPKKGSGVIDNIIIDKSQEPHLEWKEALVKLIIKKAAPKPDPDEGADEEEEDIEEMEGEAIEAAGPPADPAAVAVPTQPIARLGYSPEEIERAEKYVKDRLDEMSQLPEPKKDLHEMTTTEAIAEYARIKSYAERLQALLHHASKPFRMFLPFIDKMDGKLFAIFSYHQRNLKKEAIEMNQIIEKFDDARAQDDYQTANTLGDRFIQLALNSIERYRELLQEHQKFAAQVKKFVGYDKKEERVVAE